MPGFFDDFKQAFYGKVESTIRETLAGYDVPLQEFRLRVQLCEAINVSDLSTHKEALKLADEAYDMVEEAIGRSYLEAANCISDLASAISEGSPEAAKAIATRKSAALNAATQAVDTLVNNPANAWLADGVLAGLQKDLSDAKNALDNDTVNAVQKLDPLPQTCQTVLVSPAKKLTYDSERQKADQAIKTLKAHKQAAHVQTEINSADQAMLAAGQKAIQHDVSGAMGELVKATNACNTATPLADRYQQYLVKRAAAGLVVAAVKGRFNDAWLTARQDEMNNADTLARVQRQYVAAENALAIPKAAITDTITDWYVTEAEQKLNDLRSLPSKDFIDGDIKELERARTAVQNAIAAEDWHRAMLLGSKASGQIAPTKKIAQRHKKYVDKKQAATAEVDKLKAYNALFAQAEAMRHRIASTDALTTRKVCRFEEAILILDDVISVAGQMKAVGDNAKACKTRLEDARKRVAALTKGVPTEAVAARVSPIQTMLAEANTENDNESYEAALKLLDMIESDLGAVEGVAGKMTESTDAQKKAGEAGDAEAVKESAKELEQLSTKLGSDTHGGLVAEERKAAATALEKVAKLLEGGDHAGALAPLKEAAELLVTAQGVLVEQARFVELRKALQGRVDALKLAKAAVPNKPNIDKVEQMITAADGVAKGRDWQAAATAIRMGELEADTAELASTAREEWDKRSSALAQRRDLLSPGDVKTKATDALKESEEAADRLDFVTANKKLDTAEATMDSARVKTLLTSTPNAQEVVDRLQAMMKTADGPGLIDELVAGLPDNFDKDLFDKLAKERFGIELKLDADGLQGPAITARKIWSLISKVPEGHARNNPSLKTFRRETPGDNGGYYSSSKDLVVMNGRPSNPSQQKFGTQLKNIHGHDNLPGDVEESCKPKDENAVSYFDFATLHEVGHAVDDRLGFMDSREGQDAFGGWISHGGDVDTIAKAVAKAKSYDEGYVRDLLLKKDPAEPPPPNGTQQDVWDTARDAVKTWYALATREHVYRSQPWALQLEIDGRVYQEAYKGTWVSYKLEARKRGLTGYQFRAPGEWFAELYAGYHSGKLKDGHPSARWLKTL